MSNRFLWVGGLFILSYLVTSLTFSKPAPTSSASAPPLPVLSADAFNQQVKQMDQQTQAALDATLAKLLGSSTSSSTSTTMMPASVPVSKQSAPPSEPASPPDSTTFTTTPAPSGSGQVLNPYIN